MSVVGSFRRNRSPPRNESQVPSRQTRLLWIHAMDAGGVGAAFAPLEEERWGEWGGVRSPLPSRERGRG
jgi:hypothetical protein